MESSQSPRRWTTQSNTAKNLVNPGVLEDYDNLGRAEKSRMNCATSASGNEALFAQPGEEVLEAVIGRLVVEKT